MLEECIGELFSDFHLDTELLCTLAVSPCKLGSLRVTVGTRLATPRNAHCYTSGHWLFTSPKTTKAMQLNIKNMIKRSRVFVEKSFGD